MYRYDYLQEMYHNLTNQSENLLHYILSTAFASKKEKRVKPLSNVTSSTYGMPQNETKMHG